MQFRIIRPLELRGTLRDYAVAFAGVASMSSAPRRRAGVHKPFMTDDGLAGTAWSRPELDLVVADYFAGVT